MIANTQNDGQDGDAERRVDRLETDGKAAVSSPCPTPCSERCPKCGNAPNKLRWVDSGSDSS